VKLRTGGLIGCLVVLGGCASFTSPRPSEYYASSGLAGDDRLSLVAADAAILPDDDLRRLLDYEYTPLALNRIALLPMNSSLRSSWSADLARAVAAIDARLLETLEASEPIFDASFLPAMLVPEKRTAPYLREAAARYQADLLLALTSTCEAFQGSRLFQADQARAYCRVEAALLDVRTGLVPFSAASTKTVELTESDEDLVTQETGLRAEIDAIAAALVEIADAVVAFVEQRDTGA
jgi:hypothetical protein